MAELLRLEAVSAGYGDSVVVEEVSFEMGDGECVALLGRNGVGKTTLLTTIMGLTRFHRGVIRWRGGDIARAPAFVRSRSGIGWVPQERRMWKSLTVEEHLTSVARPGEWTVAKVHALFPRLPGRGPPRGGPPSRGGPPMLPPRAAPGAKPEAPLPPQPLEGPR